jgi:tetratricopeptide (TPR) repeat protein
MTHLLEEAIRQHKAGGLDLAADLYETFLNSEPAHFKALNALGVLRGQLNQPELGRQTLKKALAIDPENGDANANMGLMLGKLGQYPQAIGFLTKAIEKNPDRPNYMLNLAFLLLDYEKPDDAMELADILISLDPAAHRAYHARGNALLMKSEARGALEDYHVALQAFPDDPRLWSNLGIANRWLHNPSEALRCHETALALDPSGVDARWERALTLLSFGQFEAGWRDYVASKKEQGLAKRPNLGRVWDGRADLRDKSIFVYREQGLGDTIQFCRFIKQLSQSGARVFFAPHGPLKWLMTS